MCYLCRGCYLPTSKPEAPVNGKRLDHMHDTVEVKLLTGTQALGVSKQHRSMHLSKNFDASSKTGMQDLIRSPDTSVIR